MTVFGQPIQFLFIYIHTQPRTNRTTHLAASIFNRILQDAFGKEFTEYKQQMELRWEQLLKYLTLLTLGIAIALVWLFGGAIYHLFTT